MPRRRVLIPLRWSDMDAYGHVNNVQFLRLLEDARVAVFGAGAGSVVSLDDTALVVAQARIDYLAPLVYRRTPVAVDVWVASMGGASFDLAYELADPSGCEPPEASGRVTPDPADEFAVYARAMTTMVVYDRAQATPRRMSLAEREWLQGWSGEPLVFRGRG